MTMSSLGKEMSVDNMWVTRNARLDTRELRSIRRIAGSYEGSGWTSDSMLHCGPY